MDKHTYTIFQLFARQVLVVTQVLMNHTELLEETEIYDLEGVETALKDIFNLDD